MLKYLSVDIICSKKQTVIENEAQKLHGLRGTDRTNVCHIYFYAKIKACGFIILAICFATHAVLKIGKYYWHSPVFSWGIFSHMTCLTSLVWAKIFDEWLSLISIWDRKLDSIVFFLLGNWRCIPFERNLERNRTVCGKLDDQVRCWFVVLLQTNEQTEQKRSKIQPVYQCMLPYFNCQLGKVQLIAELRPPSGAP